MGDWDNNKQIENHCEHTDDGQKKPQKHNCDPWNCWFPTGSVKELWKAKFYVIDFHYQWTRELQLEQRTEHKFCVCSFLFLTTQLHHFFLSMHLSLFSLHHYLTPWKLYTLFSLEFYCLFTCFRFSFPVYIYFKVQIIFLFNVPQEQLYSRNKITKEN